MKPPASSIPGISGALSTAPAHGQRLPRRLRCVLLSLACIALSAAATYGGIQVLFPVQVPAAMRGKWVVMEGQGLKGATLEFFVDGHMIGTVPAGGEWVTIEGSAQVRGNRFRVITARPGAGFPTQFDDVADLLDRRFITTEPEEILELTDRTFVVQDSQGEVLILERHAPIGAAPPGGER